MAAFGCERPGGIQTGVIEAGDDMGVGAGLSGALELTPAAIGHSPPRHIPKRNFRPRPIVSHSTTLPANRPELDR